MVRTDTFGKKRIDYIIRARGFADYRWIVPRDDIAVARWVRFRCMFGCGEYGRTGSCPPAAPTVEECREMIGEYENAVILHFSADLSSRDDKCALMSGLLDLERGIFLDGFYKTFLLQFADCVYCKTCAAEGIREKCADKIRCRPSTDAMCVDVFQTARKAGYAIDVLKTRAEIPNRFAIILID